MVSLMRVAAAASRANLNIVSGSVSDPGTAARWGLIVKLQTLVEKISQFRGPSPDDLCVGVPISSLLTYLLWVSIGAFYLVKALFYNCEIFASLRLKL